MFDQSALNTVGFAGPGSTSYMPALCQMVPDVESSTSYRNMRAELEQKLRSLKVSFVYVTDTLISVVPISPLVSSHISSICPQHKLREEKTISASKVMLM